MDVPKAKRGNAGEKRRPKSKGRPRQDVAQCLTDGWFKSSWSRNKSSSRIERGGGCLCVITELLFRLLLLLQRGVYVTCYTACVDGWN